MAETIETDALNYIKQGATPGKAIMQALKKNHEETDGGKKWRETVKGVTINVHVFGRMESFPGTINAGGMVKSRFMLRHINKFHEETRNKGVGILVSITDENNKLLWEKQS